jgi:hypothetical protein
MFNSLNTIQTYSSSASADKGLLTGSFSLKHGKRNRSMMLQTIDLFFLIADYLFPELSRLN